MASGFEILCWVKDYFDRVGFDYELYDEKNVIKITIPLDGKLKQTNMLITFRDDSYTVNAYIQLDADEECRLRVSEYLMRATYGLRYGNFEMDFEDGEIRYRLTLDCEERLSISDDLIRSTLAIPMRMIERYGDGLIAVMYNVKTPEEAIKEAEREQ